MKANRRDFLKLGAAAAVAPVLWLPRRAFAATPGFGLTKHVLVLYAKGGFRSHCTFNAVGTAMKINPFGVHPAAIAGRQWALGNSAGADVAYSYTGSSGAVAVPSFASISGDVTVLGCVDHNPDGSADTDHRTAANRIATGDPMGLDGFLSRIGKDHPMYANGFSATAVPPVEINPTEWGLGSGPYASARPLSLLSGGNVFAADRPVGKGFKIAARRANDERFRATRSRAYRSRLTNFLVSKQNVALFADMLKKPEINVADPANAASAADGFTNAQMLEILGNHDLSTIGNTQEGMMSWGLDVAVALRFFHEGSPIAVVTRDIYDMHDDEADNYRPRVQDLTRQLAGLHYLLHQMDHPEGGKYWDKTLVVVLSEFSRNNTTSTGFNSGRGSDHVNQESGPCRNQAVAVMGGPIAASKGKLIGPTDANIEALDQTKVFTSRQLLVTLIDALGINVDYFPGANVAPISDLYV